jgi:hypothetical protein
LAVTNARDVFLKLAFIVREDLNSLSSTGDSYVPLLHVGPGSNCRIAKENVIHRFALRAAGCITESELTKGCDKNQPSRRRMAPLDSIEVATSPFARRSPFTALPLALI